MPDLSPSFVASIARALNSAQVPCVLWGQYLLNIHGVPSIIDVSAPSSQKFQTITNTCSSLSILSFRTTVCTSASRHSSKSGPCLPVCGADSAHRVHSNDIHRHQPSIFISTTRKSRWTCIPNPRRCGSYHHLTDSSHRLRKPSFPHILCWHPTRPFSHRDDQVADRACSPLPSTLCFSPVLLSC